MINSAKILSNSIYNTCAKFFSILFTIILIPYIIKHIGLELFGIWALINVIVSYIGFFDFGFGTSFVKFLAEYKAKNDNYKINSVLNTGLIFYFSFSILFFILGFLFSDILILKMKINPKFYAQSGLVLKLSLGLFCIGNIGNVISSIQDAFQRMDISGKIKFFSSLFYFIFSIIILKLGYGLLGLIFVNYFISIGLIIINIFILKKIVPFFKLNFLNFDKLIFKSLFSYGIKMYTSNIASMINFHFDKILIGYFVHIKGVGFYQIGSSMAGIIKSVPASLIAPFMPAVSEAWSSDNKKYIYDMFLHAVKILNLISFPIVIYILFRANNIINIWVGPGYEMAANISKILIIGYFFYMMSGAVCQILQGIGNVSLILKAEILSLILNICLSSVFFVFFGYYGAVFGTLAALSCSFLFLIYNFFCFFKKDYFEYFYLYIKPCICSLFSFFVCYLIFSSIHYKRGNVLAMFIIEFLVYIILYFYIIIKSGFIKLFEIKFFLDVLKNRKKIYDK